MVLLQCLKNIAKFTLNFLKQKEGYLEKKKIKIGQFFRGIEIESFTLLHLDD